MRDGFFSGLGPSLPKKSRIQHISVPAVLFSLRCGLDLAGGLSLAIEVPPQHSPCTTAYLWAFQNCECAACLGLKGVCLSLRQSARHCVQKTFPELETGKP